MITTMQRPFLLAISLVSVAFAAEQTPLKLTDILAWKRIQAPMVSSDGKWFAYKLAPNEGDTEVVLRNLTTGAEQRFAVGELPRPDPAAPPGPPPAAFLARDGAFSDDSKWLALQAYPTVKEGKLLKKQRKPAENKLILVDLATGKKTEYEGIRRRAFRAKDRRRLRCIGMRQLRLCPQRRPLLRVPPEAARTSARL